MYIDLLCMYILTTDLMTDYDKRQTRPLVREGAPNWQDRNFLYIINIWSWAPDGARHQDRLTDWPSVVNWPDLSSDTELHITVR
jgi:hypothetical protein